MFRPFFPLQFAYSSSFSVVTDSMANIQPQPCHLPFLFRCLVSMIFAALLASCGGGGSGSATPSDSASQRGVSAPTLPDPTHPGNPPTEEEPPEEQNGGNTPAYAYDTTARFAGVRSLSIGDDDALYLFDNSLRIRKVYPHGDVVTLPGELPAETTHLLVDALGDFYVVSGRDIYRHYKDGRGQHLATLPAEIVVNSLSSYLIGKVDSNNNLYLAGRALGNAIYRMDYAGNLSLFYSGAPLNEYTTGLAIDRDDKVIVYPREWELGGGHLVSLSPEGASFYRNVRGNVVRNMYFDTSNTLYLKTDSLHNWDGSWYCERRGGPCGVSPLEFLYSRVSSDGTINVLQSYYLTDDIYGTPSASFGDGGLVVDRHGNQYSSWGAAVYKRTPSLEDSVFAGNPNEAGFSD